MYTQEIHLIDFFISIFNIFTRDDWLSVPFVTGFTENYDLQYLQAFSPYMVLVANKIYSFLL